MKVPVSKDAISVVGSQPDPTNKLDDTSSEVTHNGTTTTTTIITPNTNTNNNNDEEDDNDDSNTMVANEEDFSFLDQQITALKTELATKDEKLATMDEECQLLRALNKDLKEAMVSATPATVVEDRRNHNDADLGRDVLEVTGNLIVTDVMNENAVMRHRENERLLVKITGDNGTPVYHQVSLKNGQPSKIHGDYFLVGLDKDRPDYATLSLNAVRVIEIWVGDMFLHRLNLGTSLVEISDNPSVNNFDLDRIDVPQMGTIHIIPDLGQFNNSSPVTHIMATIGPIRYNDIVRVIPGLNDATRRMSMEQLVTFYRDDAAQQIGITGLVFRNTYIRGAISILERLGISTTLER